MTHDQSASFFKTTQWSAVVAATADGAALEVLLRSYWGAIYAYVRRCGHTQEEAADLVQEFIAQVVLERGLISKADPARGRFRTFLKAAVRHFLIDQHRRATAKTRSPATPALGGDALKAVEPRGGDDPSAAFDRQWATTLLATALGRVREECESSGQQVHWAAFNRSVIEPVLGRTRARPLDEMAAELGLESAAKFSAMVQTVRRKFRRVLRSVVEETLLDPSEAEDELASMRGFLGI